MRQSIRGFTLIEVLISMTIALFLLGGLITIVQSTKNAFVTQSQNAQLQDNERLAMTFVAEVIESAGYYPDPIVAGNTSSAFFPAITPFTTAGQVFYGTTAVGSDTVTVRYGAKNNDNVFGCNGKPNTTGGNDTLVSKFSVVVAPNPANSQLVCTFSTNAGLIVTVPLVNGVTNLSVMYGVTRNTGPSTGSCADTYLTTALMQNADWLNVCSIRMTLSFNNPRGPLNPLPITRLIAAMNKAGVNP